VTLWNETLQAYDEGHVASKYGNKDELGPYSLSDLTGAGKRGGDSGLPWRGFNPTAKGRHWAVPNVSHPGITHENPTTQERLDALDSVGLIYFPQNRRDAESGFPRFKRYLAKGMPIQDVITDIPPINSQAQERLGYPTQKPEALLNRILCASSNEGDIVLDPFCGCGTTVQVAQRLKRRWIGIDITHLAIGLIKSRLDSSYGNDIRNTYEVIGEPTDVAGAAQLAEENKWQFQYWALGLCGARPTDGIKKGADRGIDGRLYFHDDNTGFSKQIVFSVKGGHNVGVSEVRDLIGVLQREKADIGVYISFEEPTRPMQREAAEAGFYTSSDGSKYPRVQLLTIKGLLEGNMRVQRPLHVRDVTFRRAPRNRPDAAKNLLLPMGEE
jgi:site-specific DNA-methyltransferase (adenine-specific)